MGFGNFLKKALNPLTPFKAIAGAGKNIAHGNVKGALKNLTLDSALMGLGPDGAPRPPRDMSRFGLPMEQNMPGMADGMGAEMRRSPMMDGARPMAMMGGARPMGGGPPMAVPPSMGAPAGPSPLQAGIQEMLAPQEENPYEAWKAGGRAGVRPSGY